MNQIKGEVAAAGRRRRTFAGKGMGAQRPTHRPLRLESVKERFCLPCTWAKKLDFCAVGPGWCVHPVQPPMGWLYPS